MFKMAIVGTAHMHCNEIALYIHENPKAELVGVADLTPEMPENTMARYTRGWNKQNIVDSYGAKPYDDYRQMLDETRPDLVFILCENDRKKEAAFECIRRGLNFSLEKPMSVTLSDAREIAAAAEEAGVEAMVNWPVIWRPYVNHFMQVVKSQPVGEIIKLEYANGHTGPLGKGAKHRGVTAQAEEMSDETRSRTWWYQGRHGGGAFLDMMCYGSLYATWIMPKPWETVTAMSMNLNTPCCDCEDNAAAIVRYPEQLAILGGTWTTPNAFMMTGPAVFCKDGVIYCSRDEQGLPCVKVMDIFGKVLDVPAFEQGDELKNLVNNYIYHKENNVPLHEPATMAFNLRVASIMEGMMTSAREHREIGAKA